MHRHPLFALALCLSLASPAAATGSSRTALRPLSEIESARARIEELAMAAHDLTTRERHHVGPLSSGELATLAEQPPGGPLLVGLTRNLTRTLELREPAVAAARETKASAGGGLLRRETDGSTTWTLSIDSAGAQALRLHFDRFLLPAGAKAYVYSAEGEAHGPYTNEFVRAIVPDGRDFWTNSVYSSTVYLEVRFDEAMSPLDLSIDSIAHMEFPEVAAAAETVGSPEATECFIDVACATENATLIGNLSRAVARLSYAKGGLLYFCTGSLVNVESTPEFEPYLLTANHCFDSQASASSLEAVWDYRANSCGEAAPTLGSLPRNLGSTLLASAKASDFTLVELSQPPPGVRSFLGWNASSAAVSNGMTFYRIAHPDGGPQRFSTTTYQPSPDNGVCTNLPLTSFIYSSGLSGGTKGGSSGGPMTNGATQILGQLFGKCGFDTSNPCNYTTQAAVDGRFSVTFPSIETWLSPSSPTEPCVPSSSTLCLQSNRFKITLSARDPRSGNTDNGFVMSSTNFFGYYAFPVLASNQTDPQIFVKVLDGRPVNNKWWVFYASLTDVEFTLTVTDTQTGVVKTYSQAPFTQKSANDTSAFN
ncbi:MAG: trypsin-like peptidase domain-containing protein [Thermoanaerobaculia bacterium]|nr:trypsin-like peptidase domain-containing protein [Thermoanaerobaculia bacterium]